jgi:hypothetical protein
MKTKARRKSPGPFQLALAGCLIVSSPACSTSASFVPDKTDRIPPPQAREGGDANDVFMRAPWELWRSPRGPARYHRGTFLLLPDDADAFKSSEVSVYAADGSDVRVDYVSVDFGAGSQSNERLSVFVYRAPADLEGEWKSVVERARRRWPGATAAEPFPVPPHHPPQTKQMALTAPARAGEAGSATFVQVTLFHQGEWAARYEIACPAADVAVARKKTGEFLRAIRVKD